MQVFRHRCFYFIYGLIKIAGLLVLMVISWLVASLILMLVPVWLGRQAFQMWLSDNPKIYELYTAALGLVRKNLQSRRKK